MKLYVKTLNGDTYTLELESEADIENTRDYLGMAGIELEDGAPLILSYKEFKPEAAPGTQLPPIPKPQNADDMPPNTSDKILIAVNPDEKLYIYDTDNNHYI